MLRYLSKHIQSIRHTLTKKHAYYITSDTPTRFIYIYFNRKVVFGRDKAAIALKAFFDNRLPIPKHE